MHNSIQQALKTAEELIHILLQEKERQRAWNSIMELEVDMKERRRGEVEPLSVTQLSTALDAAILSQGSTELALIYLIDRYELNLNGLKAILVGIWHKDIL